MNIDNNQLLELSYEIEGLLLLAGQRGKDTPRQVWQIIAEKSDKIAQYAKSTGLSEFYAGEPEATTEYSVAVADECHCDATISEAAEAEATTVAEATETVAEESDTPFKEEIFNIDELEVAFDDESAPAEDSEATEETEVTEEPENAENTESAEEDITPENGETEYLVSDYEEEPETEADHDAKADSDSDAQAVEITSDDIEPTADKSNSDSARQPITLDEKLAREQSKCLKKAFSLNDYFRFRRELFGNSDIEFADAINMVEAMESLAEANEYFYQDLQWDSENPEVIDFMQIITKHFQGR